MRRAACPAHALHPPRAAHLPPSTCPAHAPGVTHTPLTRTLTFLAQVKLALDDLATGAAALAAALSPPASASASWLRAAVAADAATAAALIASSMAAVPSPTARPPTLTARLELITAVRCPLWHCDSVGLRALVTYAGPGTRFIGSEPAVGPREVDAHDGFARPARGGAAVDERAADAAGPGDVLFLGGHLRAGGRAGGGPPYPAAVHQSPPVPAGVVRLVLTVDDAVPTCPCDAC